MWQRASLKQRLIVLMLTAIALVWLGAAAFTYHDAREEFDEVLDAHLAQTAALLLVQTAHDLDVLETEHAPLLHKYARRVAFQVWEKGQRLRLHSANAPQQALTNNERGFSDSTIDGKGWRVFSSWDESGTYLIHVAETSEVRAELAGDIAENLLRPLLLSLPLLAILLWVAVARGLLPLVSLTREVERREPENLAALDTSSSPREVMPLIERLNRLFARISASLQKERRFTADAAHELRTPIAAIKAQAQVARAASTESERNHALDNAILGCDRASRLIAQLLTLAQVDTLDNSVMEACLIKDIAAEVIADLAPAAVAKGVELELLTDAEVTVRGNPELLRVLLRNLLDNAIQHTSSGTSVQVNISHEPAAACLSVSDNGPGIAEDDRARVLERFYRPLGTQASGSGLGLSIVKRIADVHDATLQILAMSEGSGLRVKVCFRA
ncbi:MAG TPA: ATP-binding protein [Gallionellaceae bacterium]|nr:ATP-binding protein [Gallionellaceae bacterium]